MNLGRLIPTVFTSFATLATSLALGAGAVMIPSGDAHAQSPYWRCPGGGWTFRVNAQGTGAHCYRTTADTVQAISCPSVNFMGQSVGTFPQARPGRDKCRGQVTVAGVTNSTEHDPGNCPPGFAYRQNHQGNTDRCVKSGETQHQAPSQQFQASP